MYLANPIAVNSHNGVRYALLIPSPKPLEKEVAVNVLYVRGVVGWKCRDVRIDARREQ